MAASQFWYVKKSVYYWYSFTIALCYNMKVIKNVIFLPFSKIILVFLWSDSWYEQIRFAMPAMAESTVMLYIDSTFLSLFLFMKRKMCLSHLRFDRRWNRGKLASYLISVNKYFFVGRFLESVNIRGSQILADQYRPRMWAQMRGEGEGVAGSQLLSTAVHENGAQINFGDLTLYLTYSMFMGERRDQGENSS